MRIFKNLKVWVILGLIFLCLNYLNPDYFKLHSPLFFLELFLYAILLLGYLLNKNEIVYKLFSFAQGNQFLYILLSWISGMIFELTLSSGLGNFGGFNPDTVKSFLMAQGFYIIFAYGGLYLIKKYHYSLKDLYFAAIAASLWEGIVFNQTIIKFLFSPFFWIVPFTIAYYGLVYATFWIFPLVFINLESLYSSNYKIISFRKRVFYGLIVSIISFLSFIIWSFLISKIIK